MERGSLDQRLSRISTLWSVVLRAHGGSADAAAAAQNLLLERYRGAVYRYLLAAVRDVDAADELFQEFALRFLRGDFRRADPRRGRFRDYVKTALIHLVADYRRARRRRPRPLAPDGPEPAAPDPGGADADQAFLSSWRDELLERTWAALAEANPAYHAVLLCRVENPEAASADLAEQLTAQLGRPLTGAWVRKTLQRAHDKYAALLVDEVAASLETAASAPLREELRALDLLKYCRSALERRGGER
jgi:RNA polymerase sigma-70 factor (ECF subfamily)